MISVIVPVYNTAKQLSRCIQSICDQTIRDIDIILIDDGSNDGSETICDQFASRDPRIRLVHRQNQGHYLARNYALEMARQINSQYIGFVDSDDWIEPDMYETMIRKAEETKADIVHCGYSWDRPGQMDIHKLPDAEYTCIESLLALFSNVLDDYLWNKLWKISCFDNFTYCPNRSFQDAATTYKLMSRVEKVVSISATPYHYQQVSQSIVHKHDIGLINQWMANKQKIQFAQEQLKGKVGTEQYDHMMECQVKNCARAINENWGWWYRHTEEEKRSNKQYLDEMHEFSRKNIPLFGKKEWAVSMRINSFFPHFNHSWSIYMAYQIMRRWKRNRVKLY